MTDSTVNPNIERYFRILLDWMAKKKPGPFTIVETGTQREVRFEDHEDGLSTYVIAKWIKESRVEHLFYSFDLSPFHQRQCEKFLIDHFLRSWARLGLGDGTKMLDCFGSPIDFAYLDAGASPTETLEQFMQVLKWKCEPTLIVIDDTFDLKNASKGLMVMPIARQMGFQTASLMGRMGLIACGADLQELLTEFPEAARFTLEPSLDPSTWG